MNQYEPFRCYLQGDGTLLIRCAEILLARGHQIGGILTANPLIQNWAQEHQLSTLDPALNAAVLALVSAEPFDYFFSIANLSIVPAALLTLPRKAAINFHDSQLPTYAGLYATSWALRDQQNMHGITWHQMIERVDEGNILKQHSFTIDPGETAFTLNAKCYEHGITAFAELVDELASSRAHAQPQDLSQQTFFGKYERPTAAGLLDWTQSAEQLSAMVRALDFGTYLNPLTLPKLMVEHMVAAVPTLEVLSTRTPAAAGTIVHLADGCFTIASGTTDVRVDRLIKLDGEPLTVADFIATTGLSTGTCLAQIAPLLADRLTTYGRAICPHEEYWLKRLQELNPIEVPYRKTEIVGAGQYATIDLPLSVSPDTHPTNQNASTSDFLLAAFAAYLARLTGSYSFDLGFSDPNLVKNCSGLEEFFAPVVPLRIQLASDEGADATVAKVLRQLERTRKRQTYARDMIARYPELKTLREKRGDFTLPVVVAQAESLRDKFPHPPHELLVTIAEEGLRWIYNTALYDEASIQAMQRQFGIFLEGLLARKEPLSHLPLMSKDERIQLLEEWNATKAHYPHQLCVHTIIEDQIERTPDAVAIVFENQHLTYAELNRQANQLAHYLRTLGVGPDQKVGLYMERSLDLVVSLLAILKAGAAYVPLDPTYPEDRITFMVKDAEASVLLTHSQLASKLTGTQAHQLCIDEDKAAITRQPMNNVHSSVQPHNLIYMIYTSGSTGKPKGVMVEHRNVMNFFTGMDAHIPHEPPGVWLAVTSLSFDISVLELLWTLARGFKVILYAGITKHTLTQNTATQKAESHLNVATVKAVSTTHTQPASDISFSLFYFASHAVGRENEKYHLLLEGAKFADRHGFEAIWTPERHFGAFGGLYPNPAVTNAALATITQRIHLRAGSCVSPLHHPIRIAEDWALVDNLSNGRVGISFASGWQPNDFVLRPENFADRKAQMFRDIETVQKLWRGEIVHFSGPNGDVAVRTLPRPVQPSLPTWVTIAGNPETFRMAGEAGHHILTHLLGQSLEQLAEKLAIYQNAWRAAGHDGQGQVTLMVHTFVGDDVESVRAVVRQPMIDYLASALDLTEQAAWSFPTFKERAQSTGKSLKEMFATQALTEEEKQAIFNHAFERYFETSGLFGDITRCVQLVNQMKAIGVNEVACLIDFGVPEELALAHLVHLQRVHLATSTQHDSDATNEAEQTVVSPITLTDKHKASEDYSIAALIHHHHVTHMQCTPAMADMLLVQDEATAALATLQVMMIGGEAFSVALANKLRRQMHGTILNMYGPTETTVWSTTYRLNNMPKDTRTGKQKSISIGRPIANTTIYLLDDQLQPVPPGVTGELYIGGDGVVRGYWKREQLTAERFIADPFSPHQGQRLYRTGDLACYQSDGNIEFLGRSDFQVKIRGYRIEIGEIEARLDEHPAVQKSIVVAREDVPGDKRLIAYWLAANGQSAVIGELRDHLHALLPDFMIPSHFVLLDAFPLTPNQKVDRKALPAPEQWQPQRRAATFVPPQNDLEQKITDLWQELLGVQVVGVHDSFFQLGGHSILAVQAHRRLCELTGQAIKITDLFRFTTIRQLATYLRQKEGEGESTAIEANLEKSLSRAELRKQRLNRR